MEVTKEAGGATKYRPGVPLTLMAKISYNNPLTNLKIMIMLEGNIISYFMIQNLINLS
ncbi:MAG: hypothetical protein AB1348_09030 [Nitrospirota bacterium]